MKPFTALLPCFLLICGCVNPFAPKLDDSPSGSKSILGDQTTADGVFQNFKQAYAFRDSTIYGQLLASNFTFTYPDYRNHGVYIAWGRDDDIRTTHGLFQNVQRLDLIWNSISFEDSINTDVLLTKHISRNFNLTVTFTPSDIVRIDGRVILTLERTNLNDVWRISRWQDDSNY